MMGRNEDSKKCFINAMYKYVLYQTDYYLILSLQQLQKQIINKIIKYFIPQSILKSEL